MALKDVLIDELKDLYSAENQLLKALPKMAKGAKSSELKTLFTAHLAETKGQVERLKQVFSELGEKPTGKHCKGMEGVIEEGSEALEEDKDDASYDSGIIGAALRTEHYEIAGYTAAIAMAGVLGMTGIEDLLRESLGEEEAAAEKILSASHEIFQQAEGEPEEDEDDDPEEEEESGEDEKEAQDSEDGDQQGPSRKGSKSAKKGAAKKAGAKQPPAKKTAAKKVPAKKPGRK